MAVVPAFLVELAFYLVPGFEEARKRFERLGSKTTLAALLALSGLLPYCIASVGLGTFQWISLAELAALVFAASFWYAFARGKVADVLFLAYLAGVWLSTIFNHIYARPAPHVQLEMLGKLMWIRVGLTALLSIRVFDGAGFGFIPTRRDWRIGFQYYLYFLPAGGLAAYLTRFAKFHVAAMAWWKFPLYALGTFLAFLWVIALAEELFFRGLIQRSLTRELRSEAAGVLSTSALFGLVHLPLRAFPNWRAAIVAGILGMFCGLAFIRANSVRASTVTHALVVTTWRLFFAG